MMRNDTPEEAMLGRLPQDRAECRASAIPPAVSVSPPASSAGRISLLDAPSPLAQKRAVDGTVEVSVSLPLQRLAFLRQRGLLCDIELSLDGTSLRETVRVARKSVSDQMFSRLLRKPLPSQNHVHAMSSPSGFHETLPFSSSSFSPSSLSPSRSFLSHSPSSSLQSSATGEPHGADTHSKSRSLSSGAFLYLCHRLVLAMHSRLFETLLTRSPGQALSSNDDAWFSAIADTTTTTATGTTTTTTAAAAAAAAATAGVPSMTANSRPRPKLSGSSAKLDIPIEFEAELAQCLDFMYGSAISVSTDNILPLIFVASVLEIRTLLPFLLQQMDCLLKSMGADFVVSCLLDSLVLNEHLRSVDGSVHHARTRTDAEERRKEGQQREAEAEEQSVFDAIVESAAVYLSQPALWESADRRVDISMLPVGIFSRIIDKVSEGTVDRKIAESIYAAVRQFVTATVAAAEDDSLSMESTAVGGEVASAASAGFFHFGGAVSRGSLRGLLEKVPWHVLPFDLLDQAEREPWMEMDIMYTAYKSRLFVLEATERETTHLSAVCSALLNTEAGTLTDVPDDALGRGHPTRFLGSPGRASAPETTASSGSISSSISRKKQRGRPLIPLQLLCSANYSSSWMDKGLLHALGSVMIVSSSSLEQELVSAQNMISRSLCRVPESQRRWKNPQLEGTVTVECGCESCPSSVESGHLLSLTDGRVDSFVKVGGMSGSAGFGATPTGAAAGHSSRLSTTRLSDLEGGGSMDDIVVGQCAVVRFHLHPSQEICIVPSAFGVVVKERDADKMAAADHVSWLGSADGGCTWTEIATKSTIIFDTRTATSMFPLSSSGDAAVSSRSPYRTEEPSPFSAGRDAWTMDSPRFGHEQMRRSRDRRRETDMLSAEMAFVLFEVAEELDVLATLSGSPSAYNSFMVVAKQYSFIRMAEVEVYGNLHGVLGPVPPRPTTSPR